MLKNAVLSAFIFCWFFCIPIIEFFQGSVFGHEMSDFFKIFLVDRAAVFAGPEALADSVFKRVKEYPVFFVHSFARRAIKPAEYFSRSPAGVFARNLAFYRFSVFKDLICFWHFAS